MPDYSHLSAPIADTRYILAAHYLKFCMHVVEIGGHKLHQHMNNDDLTNNREFWNIDPSAKREVWNRVRTYPIPVTTFNFNHALSRAESRTGICIMGIEMYDGEYGIGYGMNSCEHIANNMQHFDTLVIDFVESNQVAKTQSLVLLGAAQAHGLKHVISFDTRWEMDSKYPEPNESFRKTRKFWVMDKSKSGV